jgi:drug/metabolite transporter (DMT)-like permease
MSDSIAISLADKTGRSHRTGIALCLLALFIIAVQDGLTKVLIRDYAVSQIVMFRFWFFTVFAVIFVSMRGGLLAAVRSRRPVLQIFRSLVFVGEIALFAFGLHYLGLAEIHALIATFPLIATALAIPILGEKVGWRRWFGVAVGFAGALVIIRPGLDVFQPAALIPLGCALLFAIYNLTTRLVSFRDSFETSTLYMAAIGCIAATVVGLPQWRAPDADGWILLLVFSSLGVIGHMMFVKALEFAQASLLQPFNYTLMVWASLIGFVGFGEIPDQWTIGGAALIVGGGGYVIWRERLAARKRPAPAPDRSIE